MKRNKRKSRGTVSGPFLIMQGSYLDDMAKLKELEEIDKSLDLILKAKKKPRVK